MDLKEIFELQSNFDQKHFPKYAVDKENPKEQVDTLTFLTLGALGELGEFANVLKKVHRGDYSVDDTISDMKAEIADVFIYLMKICQHLDIDLETAFLEKLEVNKKRFKEIDGSE